MDSAIQSFHAHVYFEADTRDRAERVCTEAARLFPVQMGRMHDKPVGPHPTGSCQLAFGREAFSDVVTWLAMNRDGLTVFTHLETGDELADHRDHGIWMGSMPALDLSIFKGGES